MTKINLEGHRPIPPTTGSLVAVVLTTLLAYSVVLLWLGLSAASIVGLAVALAGVSVRVVRLVTHPPSSRMTATAGRALRLAAHVALPDSEIATHDRIGGRAD